MSKKKLWVFGDSFAQRADGWPQILADKLHCKLRCFGKLGSSLYYSYRQLEKFSSAIESEDVVVFFITTSGRLWTKNKMTENYWETDYFLHPFIAGPDHVGILQTLTKNERPKGLFANTTYLLEFLDAAEKYYKHIFHWELADYLHEKIIEDLYKLKHQKNINLLTNRDCFNFTLAESTQHQVSRLITLWGYNNINDIYLKHMESQERIKNHWTIETNNLVAEHLYNMITGSNVNKLDLEKISIINPNLADLYYPKINNISK